MHWDLSLLDWDLSRCYDENGYYHSGVRLFDMSDEELTSLLYVTQIEQMNSPATHIYFINNLHDNSPEFETVNGITNGFTALDIKALDGFVSVPSSCTFAHISEWNEEDGEYACAALYVDGKMIDISAYVLADADTYKTDPVYEICKHVNMLQLAVRDAYWDMVDGNAECICLSLTPM